MKMKTVLFVCGHNTIRSPMAEAIYNHYAKRSHAASAGIDPGTAVKTQALAVLSRHSISGQRLQVKRLTKEMLASADKVVFLTRHHEGFSSPNAEEWDVDLPETDEGYERLFSLLRRKITELAAKVDVA